MISVIYHTYLVNDWEYLIKAQLKRLHTSGLYEECDKFIITCNYKNDFDLEQLVKILKKYPKCELKSFSNNSYEYPGIYEVKNICEQYDTKILYFHTKGVSNIFTRHNSNELSHKKITNINSWKECLEYFLIDNWKDCIDKLDEYSNVGVTCNNGWYWGNFWWSQSSHIKKCKDVDFWGRWDYEAWLNSGLYEPSQNFEYFHFNFNPYLTNIEPEWYSLKKKTKPLKDFKLISSQYGTIDFEIDEGYTNMPFNIHSDVTEIIRKNIEENGGRSLNIRVDNNILGGDPIFGYRKFLIVNYKLNDKDYSIGASEGDSLYFQF